MPRHRADASPLGPGGPLSRLFLLVVVVMHVHAVLVVAVLVDPLWGAPKIHGELLKLGIDVAQSTVSIYMVPRQGRPLRAWKIFLRNHVRLRGLISLSFRQSPFGSYSHFLFLAIDGGSCCGLRRPRTQRGVAGAPNHRSILLGHGAQISHP
jgi:hypothetical protein